MDIWKQLSCVREVEDSYDDDDSVKDTWTINSCCTVKQNRLSLLSTSRRSSSSSSTSSDSDGSYTVWGVAKPITSYPREDIHSLLHVSIHDDENDGNVNLDDVKHAVPVPIIEVSPYDDDVLENQRAKSMDDLDALEVPMTVQSHSRYQARRSTDAHVLDLKTQKHLKKKFSRANINKPPGRQLLAPSLDVKATLRKSFENLLGKIGEHVHFGRSSSRLDCRVQPTWPPSSAEIENEVEELKKCLFAKDDTNAELVEHRNCQSLRKPPRFLSNTSTLVNNILQSFVQPYVYNNDTVLTELPSVLDSDDIKYEFEENGDAVIINQNNNAVVYLAKDARDRFVVVTCTFSNGLLDWVDVINKGRVAEHLGLLDVTGVIPLDPLDSERFHFTAIVSIYSGQPETYNDFCSV
ncbi:unnamed protein product [Owenia fusiformis]|uniref:Uncharacterized protein n=1 Tax=Owenia fusiformis TaxID=6347 RepID=A0A8J1T5M6_OWEFU|nr:unnamed protein product [Owenia fusiformis]